MDERVDAQTAGAQVERLLEELRASCSAPAWRRIQELMHAVVGLHGEGLARLLAIIAQAGAGDVLRARLAEDDLLATLLILHQLHPEDTRARVASALARVTPYLGSHGGGVHLLAVDPAAGVARLRLEGSCADCRASLLTAKLVLEGAIKERAPEIVRLEVEGLSDGAAPAATSKARWTELEGMPALEPGQTTAAAVGGVPIVVCRAGANLYAYRDACPACGAEVREGGLREDFLACPACGEVFDIRHAGRALHNPEIQLAPVPLLEEGASVRIALSGAGQ